MPLTAQALKNCMQKQELLMHVKPLHLMQSNSALRTPEAFFKACALAGYIVVVAVHRDNELAHELSQVDLICRREHEEMAERVKCAHDLCEKRFCHKRGKVDMLTEWDQEYRFWRRGVRIAKANGLHVLNFTFAEVTADACGTVKQVTQVLSQAAKKKYKSPECKPTGDPWHASASLHDISAVGRMGQTAHRCLEKMIEESKDPGKYTWMLDLSQEVSPRL